VAPGGRSVPALGTRCRLTGPAAADGKSEQPRGWGHQRGASLRRESGQLRGPFTGHAEWKSKRIIAVNVQGITRKKKDFTSLPLAKIQAFSVETAGTFDLDAELELWFSGLGKVKFEFSGKTDVAYLNKLVAHHVL
jgi:Bacterial PH domain